MGPFYSVAGQQKEEEFTLLAKEVLIKFILIRDRNFVNPLANSCLCLLWVYFFFFFFFLLASELSCFCQKYLNVCTVFALYNIMLWALGTSVMIFLCLSCLWHEFFVIFVLATKDLIKWWLLFFCTCRFLCNAVIGSRNDWKNQDTSRKLNWNFIWCEKKKKKKFLLAFFFEMVCFLSHFSPTRDI